MDALRKRIFGIISQKKVELQSKMRSLVDIQKREDKLNFNPKQTFSRMEKTLKKIKLDNESVSIESFKELYTLIHRTNTDIRYWRLNIP